MEYGSSEFHWWRENADQAAYLAEPTDAVNQLTDYDDNDFDISQWMNFSDEDKDADQQMDDDVDNQHTATEDTAKSSGADMMDIDGDIGMDLTHLGMLTKKSDVQTHESPQRARVVKLPDLVQTEGENMSRDSGTDITVTSKPRMFMERWLEPPLTPLHPACGSNDNTRQPGNCLHVDWPDLDFVAQSIILKEIGDNLKSFQDACILISLGPIDAEQFLSRYRELRAQADRWEQYVRSGASDKGKDIIPDNPGPIRVNTGSLTYGCAFLSSLGLGKYIPSVQAYGNRFTSWPLNIDYSKYDPTQLVISSLEFPDTSPYLEAHKASTFGHDSAVIAFQTADPSIAVTGLRWRIHYFYLPSGARIISSAGVGKIPACATTGGRFLVLYPDRDELTIHNPNEFLIVTNAPRGSSNLVPSEDAMVQSNQPADRLPMEDPANDYEGQVEYMIRQNEQEARRAMTTPKTTGPTMSQASLQCRKEAHHNINTPTGPPHKAQVMELQDLANQGYRVLFSFHLPQGCRILCPTLDLMNFVHKNEITDELSTSATSEDGIYTFVMSDDHSQALNITEKGLPDNSLLRMTFDEPMAVFRNGSLLPRPMETGLHELRLTADPMMDVFSENGMYHLFTNMYVPPGPSGDDCSPPVSTPQGVETSTSQTPITPKEYPNERFANAIEEALEILKPYRDFLDREEEEEKKRDINEARKLKRHQEKAQLLQQRENSSVRNQTEEPDATEKTGRGQRRRVKNTQDEKVGLVEYDGNDLGVDEEEDWDEDGYGDYVPPRARASRPRPRKAGRTTLPTARPSLPPVEPQPLSPGARAAKRAKTLKEIEDSQSVITLD
ncbi:hypothetical protein F5B20DRAFT_588234 [Whalleya microplaca]|nr:hypothetical protein F5B20DRAFT_588234 [Whalleya microplaca]